jgi:hypothetical protein
MMLNPLSIEVIVLIRQVGPQDKHGLARFLPTATLGQIERALASAAECKRLELREDGRHHYVSNTPAEGAIEQLVQHALGMRSVLELAWAAALPAAV